MLKIAHITPHLGGGVGSLITNLILNDSNLHQLFLLERPIKRNSLDKLKESGITVNIQATDEALKRELLVSDIVIVHWWHHPKTSHFLYKISKLNLRIIMWSHISNLTVPSLNNRILSIVAHTVFSTQASYDSDEYKVLEKKFLEERTSVIYSCSGLEFAPIEEKKKNNGFNIGYLGLIDFSKMHPEYIKYCDSVRLEEAKFILVGDAPAEKQLIKQCESNGLASKLHFEGHVDNVWPYLAQFDVMGYPLMEEHTGSTEITILESMAAGVPVVVLNQLVEKSIISNGVTGVVVDSIEAYGEAMRFLFYNSIKREAIGRCAREYVLEQYSLDRLKQSFFKVCQKAMKCGKVQSNFEKIIGSTPAEWFISSLGRDKILFTENTLKCCDVSKMSALLMQENKASIPQYHRNFPDDELLEEWHQLILNARRP